VGTMVIGSTLAILTLSRLVALIYTGGQDG
jgi:hypothetical protein